MCKNICMLQETKDLKGIDKYYIFGTNLTVKTAEIFNHFQLKIT